MKPPTITTGRIWGDHRGFSAELSGSVSRRIGKTVDFGWGELNALLDRLHGGYGAEPPFDITVYAAEPMIGRFEHQGLFRYCNEMLAVIERGGRGLVQAEHLEWLHEVSANASKGIGPTLLDLLIETIENAPASLCLLDSTGRLIRKSRLSV